MDRNRRTGITLISLGIAIPALFFGITVPGNNFSDEKALTGVFVGLVTALPIGLVLLIMGVVKLFKQK